MKRMGRVVAASRYLFVAAVFALLALALLLIVLGTAEVVVAIVDVVTNPTMGEEDSLKKITLDVIEVVDIFLLGVAVFVLGTGLYTLFVDAVGLPDSLRVSSLGEMKGILASTIAVVLGVGYLGVLFKDGDGVDKGLVGLGVAAVIAALTFYLKNSSSH